MKKSLALLLLVLSAVPAAIGEVLVTRRLHVNSFYHEGVQRPERTDMMELWIAPRRLACLVGPARIIVDVNRDLVILVNTSSRTYAQAALSAVVTASMTPDDREATPSHDTTAKVRATKEARDVLGRNCLGYDVELHSNLDHKARAWVSADVPFDIAAYNALVRKLHAFLGRFDRASIEALLGLPGYVLSQENVADLKGEIIRVNRDVVAMAEKTPPPGLFSVPEGYARRPGLTHADVDMIASILE